ncbi:SDR family oxidoreductase [Burkholderia pseudomultivorans]|uniref:SDR family oxidoreductase n=1 Tax=Burkholderia pseudomultivorans TaxID=1207504 RepID=UPI0028745AB9|nr:SDR family oxidoreductase [Burkholderia pseudomultivorans]MDS0857512.1 SDR family oxidoreductase [Burkholderia pseudomultivorans]
MSKNILITGASSGFGRDTAETLSAAGHRVFASMRDIAGRNQPHADALQASGAHVIELDVTDDASVERGVASLLENAGHLDVLINNAGIGSAGISEAFTAKQVQALFDVNVFGIQRTLRAVLPTFRKQGEGLVVNIGSILGRVTFPFFGLYGASKFALEALTDSYRYELSTLGIDVVLVQPSNYPTNIFASAQRPADAARAAGYGEAGAIPDKMVETLAALFASDHAPNPHDVAEAIVQLVAQANGTRPPRLVVGQSFGADALNGQAASIQAQVLEGLGLAHLAEPNGRSAGA